MDVWIIQRKRSQTFRFFCRACAGCSRHYHAHLLGHIRIQQMEPAGADGFRPDALCCGIPCGSACPASLFAWYPGGRAICMFPARGGRAAELECGRRSPLPDMRPAYDLPSGWRKPEPDAGGLTASSYWPGWPAMGIYRNRKKSDTGGHGGWLSASSYWPGWPDMGFFRNRKKYDAGCHGRRLSALNYWPGWPVTTMRF